MIYKDLIKKTFKRSKLFKLFIIIIIMYTVSTNMKVHCTILNPFVYVRFLKYVQLVILCYTQIGEEKETEKKRWRALQTGLGHTILHLT